MYPLDEFISEFWYHEYYFWSDKPLSNSYLLRSARLGYEFWLNRLEDLRFSGHELVSQRGKGQ